MLFFTLIKNLFLRCLFAIINNLKSIILIVSIGTFFFLVIDTTNRPEFNRKPDDHNHQLLDLDFVVGKKVLKNVVELRDVLAITTTKSKSLEESIWQYLSLFAIEKEAKHLDVNYRIRAFLSDYGHYYLFNMFQSVKMGTINQVKDFINTSTPIIVNDDDQFKLYDFDYSSHLMILNKGIRYREVIKANEKWREIFKFNETLIDNSRKLIEPIRNIDGENVTYVGIYVTDTDQIPLFYYEKAIKLIKNLKREEIVLVLACKNAKICQQISKLADVALSLDTRYEYETFVTLSMCKYTIISNTMGALHALFSEGMATVYYYLDENKRSKYIPCLMEKEIHNWYAIG